MAKYNQAFMCLAVRRGVFLHHYPLSLSFLSVFCSVDLKISIPSIMRFCKDTFPVILRLLLAQHILLIEVKVFPFFFIL